MNTSPTAAQRDRWRRYGAFAAGVAERVRHGASYNPLSERTVQDPYPVYARLREHSPVHRSVILGSWIISRYDDVLAVARDHERFSNDSRWRSNALRTSSPGTPDGPCDTAPRYESPHPPRDRKGFTDWQSFALPQRDRPAATVVYFCTALCIGERRDTAARSYRTCAANVRTEVEMDEVNTIVKLANALRAPDCPNRPVPAGDNDTATRLIFGPKREPPARIAPDSQPFPFVVGPEDVHRLCALRTHRQMLELVGFEWPWVLEKLSAGHKFRLILFSLREAEATRATWDNLLSLVAGRSPRCAEKLVPHMPLLKATPYRELIERIGYDVDRLSSERRAEVSSFAAFADNTVPSDLGRARAFFRHTLRCTALYRGDGYTYDEHERRGAREYVMPNTRAQDLAGTTWVDLEPT